MDTKSVLSLRLDSDHLATLREGIGAGYRYLTGIVASTPVLSNFWPGKGLQSYLADPCVQYGIESAARRRGTFHCEIASNVALNHLHTRFHANGVCITTHFTGRFAERAFARKALNRGEIAARCGDLFGTPELVVPEFSGPIYAHLLHGGESSPVSASLAIADAGQGYPWTPWLIDFEDVVAVDVEAVEEKMSFALRNEAANTERDRDAG